MSAFTRRVFSIGLTGGIASGKSSARRLIQEKYGARVIDADKLGHACYVPGHPCLAQVVGAFGPDNILTDGKLDRAKLGGIVFSDPNQMQKLNKIVWPHIRQSLSNQLDDIRVEAATGGLERKESAVDPVIVVCEAAVLVEAGWQDLFDEVWVVHVTPEVACRRLMSRNSISLAEAQKRQQSQISNEARLGIADVSVSNDKDLQTLKTVLAKEWTKLKIRLSGKSLNADEMLDVVDPETNTVQCSMRRAEVKAKRLCYRATYIFVRQKNLHEGGEAASSTGKFKLYVQRRSAMKDYCPGQLDPVFGGCVGSGESYEENASRELEEELGIKDAPLSHLFTFFYPGDISSGPIWGDCWEAEIDADPSELKIQPEEVDEVMLMTPDEILSTAESATEASSPGDRVTPDSVDALKRYMVFLDQRSMGSNASKY